MDKQRLDLKEGAKMILQQPEMKMEAEIDQFSVEVETDAIRRTIKLAIDGTMAEITYENGQELTPEFMEMELQRHEALLEVAQKIKKVEQKVAALRIEEEMSIDRVFRLCPENYKRFMLVFVKIMLALWHILTFKSPFIEKGIVKNMSDRLTIGMILLRIRNEIEKQRSHYEQSLQTPEEKEQMEPLIATMQATIHELDMAYSNIDKQLSSQTKVLMP